MMVMSERDGRPRMRKMKKFRVRPRGGVAYTFVAEFLDVQDMRRRFGSDVHMAWIPNQKQHIVRRGKKLVAVVTELESK